MKKRKSTKHTAASDKTTKKSPYKYFDEYHELFTGRAYPVSELFLENLMSKMKDYIEELRNDLCNGRKKRYSYTVEEFYASHGIPYRTCLNWCDRYPPFKSAHEELKWAMGRLRLAGALHGDLKEATVHKEQWHYSPLWAESEQRHALLREQAGQSQGVQYVVLEKYPETDIVASRASVTTPDEVAAQVHKTTANSRQVGKAITFVKTLEEE